ncbi:MAG: hypothetical protein EXQ84_01365 [Rhodospirillaceae bacterium]|nr:hypothetical protein [Rhodospirillaceae bacterium]
MTSLASAAASLGRRITPPRALAAVIFTLLAIIILATFRDYGNSWDERLQNAYGEKLLGYYTTGFDDRSAFSFLNLFLYGGFFDLLAALANLISPFGTFETRHLLGGLIFLAGLLGGWKLTLLLAGERAALIALACLVTTPLLYGHGFINPKDSPFAWLGLWTIYFGCRLIDTADGRMPPPMELRAIAARGRPPWGVIAGLAISLGLTVGTRVVGLIYLPILAAVFAVSVLARTMNGESPAAILQRMKNNAFPFAVAAILAIMTMALVWPWSVQKLTNIFAAFQAFEHFAFYPQVLWNGELIRADAMPESYLLGLLALQLPEHVLVGLFAAVTAGILVRRESIAALFSEPRAQQYLVLICSALAPIAGYMGLKPTIYNGLRHFLFVVPPLVILGAIGLDHALSFAWRKGRAIGAVIGTLLILGISRQIVIMSGLHPYQYVAYNALIGGIEGAESRFELDYWGITLAESARGLGAYLAKNPTGGATTGGIIHVFACGDRISAEPFLPPGTALTEVIAEADFSVGMTGVLCQDHAERPGRTIFEVRRLGVQLGYVLDLRAPPQN